MFLDMGWIANGVLLVLCALWCHTVLSHLTKDMQKFKSAKQNKQRRAIVIIWTVTTAILILAINFTFALIHNITEAW
jgi:uncharacterized membrane protein